MRLFMLKSLCVTAALSQAAFGDTINVPGDAATIQGGIALALPGDEVVVAPGTYVENINFNGKAITVRSVDPTDPGTVAATIIDAGGSGRPVTCTSGETLATILDGFTITGGNPASTSGGGMLIDEADATVRNCVFTGNHAPSSGGAIAAIDSSPVITNCTFISNTALGSGGAIINTFGDAVITGCTFIGNSTSISSGGAINAGISNIVVVNSTFSGNFSAGDGGAIVIVASEETPSVTNCTFNANSAAGNGDAIYSHANSGQFTLANCILRNGGVDEIYMNSGVTIVTYSNVEGGFTGVGNIDADPLFLDADGPDDSLGTPDDDLRLGALSPCTDAGDNTAADLAGLTVDLDGLPRFFDDNDIPDTGVGTAPVVDLGAYERQESSVSVLVLTTADSIQAAIDNPAINDGDTIILSPGTYHEAINLRGKAITIQSTTPDVIDGLTILWGEQIPDGVTLITCNSGEGPDTVIKGLTIATRYFRQTRGMNNDGASPTVINCWFNQLDDPQGAGMRNVNGASPTVIGCAFDNNEGEDAAGIYNRNGSSPVIIDCVFESNYTDIYGDGGAAIANFDNSNPTITGCTFTENFAVQDGAAIYCESDCSPIITDCGFFDNSSYVGGAVICRSSSNATLSNCTFEGNQAISGGAIAASLSSDVTISGCTFIGNKAHLFSNFSPGSYNGGAIACWDATLIITNCTFTRNSATNSGGVLFATGGNTTLTNCILWDNSPNQFSNPNATVSYSIVEGGYSGIGNVDADPRFLADDDLRLCDCSPAIDAGDNTAAIAAGLTTDFNGEPRFVDDANVADTGIGGAPIVDIGAYERQEDTSLYFEVTSADSVQEAIDLACPGSEIVLAEGTYSEAINLHGQITLRSTDPGDPTVVAATILDGTGLGGSIVTCDTGVTPITNMIGLTIANADILGDGGGMHNIASSPTVAMCVFTGNVASIGGAMLNESGSMPILIDCAFTGNEADLLGGAISNFDSSPTLLNCVVSGNLASVVGAGMYSDADSNPTLVNCTFGGNMSTVAGGGIFNINNSSATVANCIFWGNTPDQIADFASASSVSYSTIQGGFAGTGNIDADPLFVDAASGDLRLSECSPAIDAGDNTAADSAGLTMDHDGNPRFIDDPGVTDTGNGSAPLVDMGAFEFQDESDCCVADWNGDSLLNTGDFLAYLGDYSAVISGGDPIHADPDLTAPYGVVNTSDFLEYLNLYGAGCD